jgi:hypothetical protein
MDANKVNCSRITEFVKLQFGAASASAVLPAMAPLPSRQRWPDGRYAHQPGELVGIRGDGMHRHMLAKLAGK